MSNAPLESLASFPIETDANRHMELPDGTRQEDAARASGVPIRTLHRWIKNPTLDKAYRQARRAVHSQGTARLTQLINPAISILGKLLVDPNTPAATKARAIEIVLNQATKAIETEDYGVRIAALENAAEVAKGTR